MSHDRESVDVKGIRNMGANTCILNDTGTADYGREATKAELLTWLGLAAKEPSSMLAIIDTETFGNSIVQTSLFDAANYVGDSTLGVFEVGGAVRFVLGGTLKGKASGAGDVTLYIRTGGATGATVTYQDFEGTTPRPWSLEYLATIHTVANPGTSNGGGIFHGEDSSGDEVLRLISGGLGNEDFTTAQDFDLQVRFTVADADNEIALDWGMIQYIAPPGD